MKLSTHYTHTLYTHITYTVRISIFPHTSIDHIQQTFHPRSSLPIHIHPWCSNDQRLKIHLALLSSLPCGINFTNYLPYHPKGSASLSLTQARRPPTHTTKRSDRFTSPVFAAVYGRIRPEQTAG